MDDIADKLDAIVDWFEAHQFITGFIVGAIISGVVCW